ncbi:MAG: hypothetical protein WC683_14950 [bacterium]
MKKTIFAALIAAMTAAALAGCSDSRINSDANPDIAATGAVISKIELVDALWELNDEPLPNAECVAGSSFKIYPTDGFEIQKNSNKSAEDFADAVIVSSVNISFTDEGNDGRGVDCGSGDMTFTVSASEEAPINIVSSQQILARHSVANMAKVVPTTYPPCTITAHFEKAGVEICETTDDSEETAEVEDEEEVADEEADEQDEEVVAEDDDAEQDDDVADDDADDNVVVVAPGVFTPVVSRNFKAFYVDEPVKCGESEVHSLRMVVDDFNCRLQETTPTRLGEEIDETAQN